MADYSHTKRTLSFMKIIAEQDQELRVLRQTDKEELSGVSARLDERTNELNSLYEMLHLRAGHHSSLGQLLQAIVDLIPPAFQHSGLASARIRLHRDDYRTGRDLDSKWTLVHDITVGEEKVGIVEVCFARDMPHHQQFHFSSEARRFLAAVAENLSQIIARECSRGNTESTPTP